MRASLHSGSRSLLPRSSEAVTQGWPTCRAGHCGGKAEREVPKLFSRLCPLTKGAYYLCLKKKTHKKTVTSPTGSIMSSADSWNSFLEVIPFS